jgi:hypothetical protein
MQVKKKIRTMEYEFIRHYFNLIRDVSSDLGSE